MTELSTGARALADLLLESNATALFVPGSENKGLPHKFTGREANALAQFLVARGVRAGEGNGEPPDVEIVKGERDDEWFVFRLPAGVAKLAGDLEAAHGAITADLEDGLDEVDEFDTSADFWLKFATELLVRACVEAGSREPREAASGGGDVLRAPVQRDCPHCEGRGWYVQANHNTGEPEQVQCEFCLATGKLYVGLASSSGERTPT